MRPRGKAAENQGLELNFAIDWLEVMAKAFDYMHVFPYL